MVANLFDYVILSSIIRGEFIMIERLNKKIQECKYNTARKKFMNLWIPNLGTIKEEEDKIICYVR